MCLLSPPDQRQIAYAPELRTIGNLHADQSKSTILIIHFRVLFGMTFILPLWKYVVPSPKPKIQTYSFFNDKWYFQPTL